MNISNISQLDADGNEVDGSDWVMLEESFQEALDRFRREGKDGAVALAWRLVASANDVPADDMQQYTDCWLVPAEADELPEDCLELPGDTWDRMIAEIGRAEYAPADATAFIAEFIRRVSKALGMESMTRHRCRKVTKQELRRTMRGFVEVDDGAWTTTEWVLNDPLLYRRLVRTQIEELLALYRRYPLPEFESVRQILTQLQGRYSDVAPFDHPLLAALDDGDDDDDPGAVVRT